MVNTKQILRPLKAKDPGTPAPKIPSGPQPVGLASHLGRPLSEKEVKLWALALSSYKIAKPSATKKASSLFLGQGRFPLPLTSAANRANGLCGSTYFWIPVVGTRFECDFSWTLFLPVR
ncbi:hypothetical protein CEXT_232531 [Caerostris extrusa]|uniref:Uncharacterized protein n=1 Tax=Caerostris extrusa TaxID=172846 RepID=A0AAV4X8H2_CAEEX|nr:hypothetical protein CEXT_232531 [Caerostris extrusa]